MRQKELMQGAGRLQHKEKLLRRTDSSQGELRGGSRDFLQASGNWSICCSLVFIKLFQNFLFFLIFFFCVDSNRDCIYCLVMFHLIFLGISLWGRSQDRFIPQFQLTSVRSAHSPRVFMDLWLPKHLFSFFYSPLPHLSNHILVSRTSSVFAPIPVLTLLRIILCI